MSEHFTFGVHELDKKKTKKKKKQKRSYTEKVVKTVSSIT